MAEKLLSQPRTASHTTESSGGEKVVGGEKVKNLLDCNPDERGKGSENKVSRMNEKNQSPLVESLMLKEKNIANMYTHTYDIDTIPKPH